MLEITFLGTGLVVAVIVGVAATFLWLSAHRYSAALLLVATAGGIILNNVLKLGFSRPRPHVFTWGTQVISSSFPSGHAASAFAFASGVSFALPAVGFPLNLAAAVVAYSRVHTGVHYPGDVVAGAVAGAALAPIAAAARRDLGLRAAARARSPKRGDETSPRRPRRSSP